MLHIYLSILLLYNKALTFLYIFIRISKNLIVKKKWIKISLGLPIAVKVLLGLLSSAHVAILSHISIRVSRQPCCWKFS